MAGTSTACSSRCNPSRPAHTLVVASLVRSLAHLVKLVTQLEQRQVKLRIAGNDVAELTSAQILRHVAQLEVDQVAVEADWVAARVGHDKRGPNPSLRPVEALQLRQLFDAGHLPAPGSTSFSGTAGPAPSE